MNYQVINNNKKAENFIKNNLVLQFPKAEAESFKMFLITTAFNLAKTASQFLGYSLVDVYLKTLPPENQSQLEASGNEDTTIVERAIQKLKPYITYIYVYKNDGTDDKILALLENFGVKYITLNLDSEISKQKFLEIFKAYRK